MADRIRFHLDEHVDPAIATALRRAGIEVTTTIEAGLRTKNDEAHLRFARTEGRVIVIRDQDFLRLAAQMGDHRGIVLNGPIGALARLQIGRAYAMQGDTAKAKSAYQDFLTLWKDADSDIPIFIAAKAEYAKL